MPVIIKLFPVKFPGTMFFGYLGFSEKNVAKKIIVKCTIHHTSVVPACHLAPKFENCIFRYLNLNLDKWVSKCPKILLYW